MGERVLNGYYAGTKPGMLAQVSSQALGEEAVRRAEEERALVEEDLRRVAGEEVARGALAGGWHTEWARKEGEMTRTQAVSHPGAKIVEHVSRCVLRAVSSYYEGYIYKGGR